jgi:predicted permease
MRGIRRLFRFPTRSSTDVRRDVDDEIGFHLELRRAELVAEGLTAAEARKRALDEFGSVADASSSIGRADVQLERERSMARLAADVRRDMSFALRIAVRDAGFTTTAVLTLSLAIGGNTAVFSAINALFLQPLAFRAPDEIVRIHTGESTVSLPNLDDIRLRSTAFTAIVAQARAQASLSTDTLPVRLSVGLVSPNYFDVLGAVPLAGRAFRPDDSHADVVVLSEQLWRGRFDASPAIVGRRLTIDGRRREVLGVMPRSFRGIVPPGFVNQIWLPIDADGLHRGLALDRAATRFEAFGRLQPDVAIAEAAASTRVVGAQMATEHPDTNARFGSIDVFAVNGIGIYRGVAKTLLPVFVFIGLVTVVGGFVLAISCANLAGLLLARGAARRREIAVRLALGASRGRIIRQLLAESLCLALLGGVAGVALAGLLVSALSRLSRALPVAIDLNLAVDARVVGYAIVVTAATALLFGLAPARQSTRLSLVEALNADAAGGHARQRLRKALIVSQVAVSALLIFWSGLFLRSLLHSNAVQPGFDPNGVLLAEIQLPDDGPRAAERADAAFVQLDERVRALPGVEAAGWSSIVPLALLGNERFRVARADGPADDQGIRVVSSRLGPGWFEAVRIPFAAGRDFAWQDRTGSPPVVIVNDTLSRQLFDGRALGQRLRIGSVSAEIVGIVRDSKYSTLGETFAATVYRPFRQVPAAHPLTLHVRSARTSATAEQIRAAANALLPGAPIELRPMRDAVAVAQLPARIGAIATGAFGLLGALLATMGIYGLITYLVVQKSREVAIRRAIGAPAWHIVRVAVGGVGRLAGIGAIAGLGAGALTAPLFGDLLVNVSPRDPLTLAATLSIVLVVGIVAGMRPALSALRVSPAVLLRAQ